MFSAENSNKYKFSDTFLTDGEMASKQAHKIQGDHLRNPKTKSLFISTRIPLSVKISEFYLVTKSL
jgi:hypothetical protein